MEEEQIEEQEERKKSPIWILAGVFILLMFVLSIIPFWAIRADPSPSYIPTLSEVVPDDLTYNVIVSDDFRHYIILDPEIKTIADNIVVKACNSGETVCHAKALFYFVRDEFEYVSDPTKFELIKTPKQSLVNQGGDCDDASVLLATMLESIGISTRLVFVPGHVYVEAWIPTAPNRYKSDDSWVPMDGTCSSCEFGEIHWSYSDDQKRTLIV